MTLAGHSAPLLNPDSRLSVRRFPVPLPFLSLTWSTRMRADRGRPASQPYRLLRDLPSSARLSASRRPRTAIPRQGLWGREGTLPLPSEYPCADTPPEETARLSRSAPGELGRLRWEPLQAIIDSSSISWYILDCGPDENCQVPTVSDLTMAVFCAIYDMAEEKKSG